MFRGDRAKPQTYPLWRRSQGLTLTFTLRSGYGSLPPKTGMKLASP